MKRILKIIKWTLGSILTLLIIFLGWFWIKYGGSGEPFGYQPTARAGQ